MVETPADTLRIFTPPCATYAGNLRRVLRYMATRVACFVRYAKWNSDTPRVRHLGVGGKHAKDCPAVEVRGSFAFRARVTWKRQWAGVPGPAAPSASTCMSTGMRPAFSKTSTIGTRSPFCSGAFSCMNMT